MGLVFCGREPAPKGGHIVFDVRSGSQTRSLDVPTQRKLRVFLEQHGDEPLLREALRGLQSRLERNERCCERAGNRTGARWMRAQAERVGQLLALHRLATAASSRTPRRTNTEEANDGEKVRVAGCNLRPSADPAELERAGPQGRDRSRTLRTRPTPYRLRPSQLGATDG